MTDKANIRGAVLWSFVAKFSNQGISFIVFLIIARILGPAEYGVASVCFIFLAIVNFTVFGLADGIVSLQIKDKDRLSSIFMINAFVGLLFCIFFYFASDFIAQLVKSHGSTEVFRLFSVVFPLLALTSVPSKILYLEMRFKVFAVRSVICSVLSGFVGVYLAYVGFGAMSIVWQQITYQIAVNLIVWSQVSCFLKLKFNTSLIREVLKPGAGAVLSDALDFAEQQLPRFAIGYVLGPVAVGFHAFTSRMKYAFQDILVSPSFAVLYPALSSNRDDVATQTKLIKSVVEKICFFLFGFVLCLIISLPDFFIIIFGEKWADSLLLLQLSLFSLLVVPFYMACRELLRAYGHILIYARLQFFLALSSLFFYLVFLKQGLEVVFLILIFQSWLALPLFVFSVKRCIGFSLFPIFKPIFNLLFIAFLIFSSLLCLLEFFEIPFRNLLSGTFFLLTYLIVYLFFFRRELKFQVFFNFRK